MRGSILVVDDERGQREILGAILKKAGYDITAVPGAREALDRLGADEYDVVLTDLKMQDMSGMELLERILEENSRQCIIIMTAHGTIDSAVEAMKKGAFDYLEKPLEREDLLMTIQRALDHLALVRENRMLQKQLDERAGIPSIIGSHPKMKEVFRIVRKIAATASTVLIYGESGTGKELVARAIHETSPRRDKPFFAINCAAIPKLSSKANCSATRKVLSPGPPHRRSGSSKPPTAERYSWTRSGK
jgi:DNA-binding NtrC family response regulator